MNNIWHHCEEQFKEKIGLNQEDYWVTSFDQFMDMVDGVKTIGRHWGKTPQKSQGDRERESCMQGNFTKILTNT